MHSSRNSSSPSYILSINDTGNFNSSHLLSNLYNTYINFDKSNKVKNYFAALVHFAKVHGLCDPEGGTLSVEGWLIIGLHVLLRYEVVSNMHHLGLFPIIYFYRLLSLVSTHNVYEFLHSFRRFQ